jgi:hypothetical protein
MESGMMAILELVQSCWSGLVKKWQLYFLFRITAEAFGCRKPHLGVIFQPDALQEFARFTREQAEKALRSAEDSEKIRCALYGKTYRLGLRIRKVLRLSDPMEVLSLCQFLYKNIEIELEGKIPGELTIKSCYFSTFYSFQVCQFISAMDEGIIAGLSGGGKLQFTRRLTEGSHCCRAILYFEEENQ